MHGSRLFPQALACALTLMAPPLVVAQSTPGFFRCNIDGRAHYQAEPCADARTQAQGGGGTFTRIERAPAEVAPPMPRASPDDGKDTDDAAAKARARRGAAAERMKKEAAKRAERCTYHRRAIEKIDAKARQRSTPRLAEQRRKHNEAMWSLECGSP